VPTDVINRARDLLIGFEADSAAPQSKPRRKPAQQDQLSLFE